MVTLTIKSGSKHEVKKGSVDVSGPCVVMRELNTKTGEEPIVFAYHLNPGETLTKGKGDDYIVEY